MAVRVYTDDPQGLLDAVYQAIDEGTIVTWAYDDDGDFTHTTASEQWEGQAWLTPIPQSGCLLLNILGAANVETSKEIYAVYHGRFIEMLLVHFDEGFSRADATAQPIAGDLPV